MNGGPLLLVGLWLAAALITAHATALAQGPERANFQPLVTDPKEPRFFATYLWDRSPWLASRLGSVGFGQTVGLVPTGDWQLAIAAGVFSQFNMQSATTDLVKHRLPDRYPAHVPPRRRRHPRPVVPPELPPGR